MHRSASSFAVLLLLPMTLQLVACYVPPQTVQVTRIDEEQPTDLSGRWNDTDAKIVAASLIRQALDHPWSVQALNELGRKPVLIVQTVRNRSFEHIDTSSFIQELQRELINSGRVSFVASASEREALRNERRDQDLHATDDTRKNMGNEIGADYAMGGEINASLDRVGGTSVMTYQVTVKITHIETNQIVWTGTKKLKKQIQRAESTW
jgi:hypothetical protein